MAISTILLLLALICFVCSTFGVGAKVNLQSAGLALGVAALLIA